MQDKDVDNDAYTQSYAKHIARLQGAYEEALEATGYSSVVLHSGRGLRQRAIDDQYWPLKVNPSFSQWVPLQNEDTMVVIQKGQKPTLIRPTRDDFWEGPAPEPSSHYAESFDLVECPPDKVASTLPSEKLAWIGDASDAAADLGIPQEAMNPIKLVTALDALRVIKSEYEIQCLSVASKIAARGHAHVATIFKAGHYSELDLHLEYLRVTQQNAGDTPYSNIVAQGTNAAVLHHVHYTRNSDARENLSLLVDAGATWMGYASDITRTHVRGESAAAKDFAALIAGVEAFQLELCAQVKPGLAYEDLHNDAHHRLAKLLLECEIATGVSASGLVEQGITRAFFPHGLGHSLGLQVHDVGCRLVPPTDQNPFLRNTSTIAAGQVFTIEPGCYFIEGLLGPVKAGPASNLVSWPTVDALRPFGGIRIEDNLAVTESASINLTRDNWPSQP
jgi:Xaa-Pro dipeptidase